MEEEVYLNDYRDLQDARARIERFIDDDYLSKRIHSSLGYLPPYDSTEFRMRPQKAGKEHSVLVGVRVQREIAFEVRQL
jgi:transposase InsO family protein